MGIDADTVSTIMQTEFASLGAKDRLDLADLVMNLGRIRHLPVLESRRLVGIVSNRDVLAASLTKALDFEPSHRRAFLRSIDVEEVMTRDVKAIAPETSLMEAARVMVEHKIGCLPVVDTEGLVVGLVTETDLLRRAYSASADLGSSGEAKAKRFRRHGEDPSRAP